MKMIKAMCEMMLKVSKEALTVLIVTHVTHVERVESFVCGFNATLYTDDLVIWLERSKS